MGSYWEGYGPKVGRRVRNRSGLEHDYFVTLEADLAVATYCEEPLTISAVVAGRRVRSRFDFWVLYIDGREEFVEVKYEREKRAALPGTRTWFQIEAQKAWCAASGFAHQLRTETTIRAEPCRLENWKQILGYLSGGERDAPSPRTVAAGEELWAWLNRQGGATLGEEEAALRGSFPGVDARECLFRLLRAGRVAAPDLAVRLLDSHLRFEAREQT